MRPIVSLMVLAGFFLVAAPASAAPRSALIPQTQDQLDLRQDIQLLNLVNGLYLSPEQMRALVKEIMVSEQLRQECEATIRAATAAAQPVLKELRESLMAGRKTSDDLARRVHASQAPIREALQRYEMKRLLLVDDVKKILNDNQVELIRDYAPCLIPPHSPSSAAIGQLSSDHGPTIRLLERIRGLPAPLWEAHKQGVAQRLAERALFYGRVQLTQDQKQHALALMEKARSLSDVEWQGQKTALAAELQALVNPDHRPRGDLQLAHKIAQFMLNPRLAPILQARLSQGSATAQAQ